MVPCSDAPSSPWIWMKDAPPSRLENPIVPVCAQDNRPPVKDLLQHEAKAIAKYAAPIW